ncbi:MAG: septation protein SpoVG family protein [Candidatus Omnitrophota bacterium]
MEITEVKVFLKEGQDKKLKAYATLTFDNCFVVRNVKVIEGNKGLFVAMPSRKIKDPCPKCGFRNSVRMKFCNQCGTALPQAEPRPIQPGEDMARLSEHKDIAHPITTECRDYIQKKVLDAYEKEKKSPSAPAGSYTPSSQTAAPLATPLRKPAVVEEDNDIEL